MEKEYRHHLISVVIYIQQLNLFLFFSHFFLFTLGSPSAMVMVEFEFI